MCGGAMGSAAVKRVTRPCVVGVQRVHVELDAQWREPSRDPFVPVAMKSWIGPTDHSSRCRGPLVVLNDQTNGRSGIGRRNGDVPDDQAKVPVGRAAVAESCSQERPAVEQPSAGGW